MNIPDEQDILRRWGGNVTPVVSVRCITFNHSAFIEQTIQGVLTQITNFPYELLIHDDASTDGTADVVRRYAEQYPTIIRAILQTENQYSKGNKPGLILTKMCRGKYIAVCEGDDYWADPRKLQVQVDFLEQNPDYVISCHDALIIDPQGNKVAESKLPAQQKRDFSGDELMRGKAWLLTLSWLHRNLPYEDIPERSKVLNGDTFFTAYLGQFGKSKFHHDIKPAAYRQHSGGIWSSVSKAQRHGAKVNTYFWLASYFFRVGNKDVAKAWLYKLHVATDEYAVICGAKLPFRSRLRRLLGSLKRKFFN